MESREQPVGGSDECTAVVQARIPRAALSRQFLAQLTMRLVTLARVSSVRGPGLIAAGVGTAFDLPHGPSN